METNIKRSIEHKLKMIYENEEVAKATLDKIIERFKSYQGKNSNTKWVSEKDTMLITYGDSLLEEGVPPLKTLHTFINEKVGDVISSIHILPMFPYTSDDGFSVVDYKEINKDLGSWSDIEALSKDYTLMFDAVINHISKSSRWFQGFLNCEAPYKDYFITADPEEDYSQVTRPRALPLLTPFETKEGTKYVWTTFSDDQIDLNYENTDLLIEILDILIQYAIHGARFIRLDAIGFLWKEKGTCCMHLPKAHEVIKLMRMILDTYVPGTIIITETNVPHKDNISYFGNGHDEAQLVYQFPLPPLTMYSLLKGDASKLTQWAMSLEPLTKDTTYFNFLASHDGIGVRPTEGILTDEDREFLVDKTLHHGGRVSFRDNGDGTKSPYELNVSYQDALTHPNEPDHIRRKRFLAAQTILLSIIGVPGIYIHSLLGSRNDYYGALTSGINRRINREKLNANVCRKELEEGGWRLPIFEEMIRRIDIRKNQPSFSPMGSQEVLNIDHRIFALKRESEAGNIIYALINVSSDIISIRDNQLTGIDLLTDTMIGNELQLLPYQSVWINHK